MLFDSIIDFIRYRTYDRYNVIKIRSLTPAYYDTDTRLLYGAFDLLVDFVEHEKAHMERIFGEPTSKSRAFAYRWVPSFMFPRSRELGLKYIEWEISLENAIDEYSDVKDVNKNQSLNAKEIKELYLWWKDIRPNRKDPLELSGFSKFCDQNRNRLFKFKKCFDSDCYEMYDELSEEEKRIELELIDKSVQIEEQQNKEDEDMLIRLIKIRRTLWT